jgi:hypothetical protein
MVMLGGVMGFFGAAKLREKAGSGRMTLGMKEWPWTLTSLIRAPPVNR